MATIARTTSPNNAPVENDRSTFTPERELASAGNDGECPVTSSGDSFYERSTSGNEPQQSALDAAAANMSTSDADAFVDDLVMALLGEAIGSPAPTTNSSNTVSGNVLAPTENNNPPEETTGDGGEISWGIDSQTDNDSSLTGQVSAAGEQEAENASEEPAIDSGDGYSYNSISNASYIQANGSELFPSSGPSPDDVVQGDNGDCYLMASAAALANSNPNALKNMIQDNGNGTYAVTLYYQGNPETINVDDKVPEDANGDPMDAQFNTDPSNGKAVTWPLILEKAFAKFSDMHPDVLDTTGSGYNALNNGGYGTEAMAALTGQAVYTNSPSNMSQSDLLRALTNAGNGQSVTLGTDNSNTNEFTSDGLLTNHMYTVLGTAEGSDGQTYVKLRDPWGYEPNSPTSSDGTFYLPLSEVANNFQSVVVGQQSLSGVDSSNNQQANGAFTAPETRFSA